VVFGYSADEAAKPEVDGGTAVGATCEFRDADLVQEAKHKTVQARKSRTNPRYDIKVVQPFPKSSLLERLNLCALWTHVKTVEVTARNREFPNWRNQAITRFDPGTGRPPSMSDMAIFRHLI